MSKYTRKRINKLEKTFMGISDRVMNTSNKIKDTLLGKLGIGALNAGIYIMTGVPTLILYLTAEYIALTSRANLNIVNDYIRNGLNKFNF